ncbi:hypothetical protein QRX50_06385 [Amycolatopsis carbonis]|uniref:Anti-sigma factor n=1 Tax=Amycolatopsis carbonis TaxID=715471 RepID=A0A9Y2IJ64_9PSEU|nr:hypothetical protein [Amycolatopsis sp. 2-15]WIX80404.1 hypothetical protein QRX50_06385 [Amycolatopsis sp. 2-15]
MTHDPLDHAHALTCEHCRKEVASVREMQEFLEAIPPELLLDGPPDDADLLLQRTLRQVRSEASGARRRGRTLAATAAVAVAAAALGLGALLGHTGTAPPLLPAAAPDPDLAVAPRPDPMMLTGSAGPTHLSAAVTPARGWVRVEAHVRGLPNGTQCRLVVLGKDGTRQLTGGWRFWTSATGDGAELYGSASMPASEVAAVTLEDMSGHEFVRTGV